MTDDEMLRLACLYAESDQLELLDAYARCDDAEGKRVKRQIKAFLKKLRAYRLKRWGRTTLETIMADAKEVAVLPRTPKGNADA